jgi:hypothetical protein
MEIREEFPAGQNFCSSMPLPPNKFWRERKSLTNLQTCVITIGLKGMSQGS